MLGFTDIKAAVLGVLKNVLRDNRGNVALIAAFCMVPMMIGVGIGVDYALQQQERDQLNGIADAAVLVPLTPSLMQQPQIVAQLAAQNFWNTQSVTVRNATGVSGLVNVTDVVSGSSLTRQVSLSWSGTSTNSFSSLVGLKTLPLSGSSQAASGLAPAINFYLMVDTSPSMGIVSTAQGIQTMVNATPSQGGCAFACHEQYPANDKLGNPLGEDNYALARNLGLTLRLDVVNYAVSSMIKSAATTALTNNTKYGVSVSTIDYQVGQVYQTGDVSSNMVAATSATANIQQLEVAYENCLSASNCNAYGAGNDQDSFLDLGLSTLNTTNLGTYNVSTGPGYRLYKPGYGTKNPGDSPQEVVFIITDGVVDESYNGGRAMAPVNTLVDNCSKIKASGVRVAFLYLTYNPLPTNSFYNSYIAPFQPNIATAAQSCASPGLYQQVNTGGDVNAALSNLFQTVVATAHLTH